MESIVSALLLAAVVTTQTQVVDSQPVKTPQQGTPTEHIVHYRPAPIAAPALHPIQQRLVEQTNAARARYGLPPLMLDMSLVRSAERHTAWMTNSRTMQHSHAQVAENIAMGQRSVSEAIQSWMNSPGHRANMLNSSYRRLGVAAYRTPNGTIYWCQQFMW